MQTVLRDQQEPSHWAGGIMQAPLGMEKEHLTHPGEIRAGFQVEETPR